jgi:3-hydroxybutyryl-CoA dehydrogenase
VSHEIETIGVVGAGTMGHGIAQVAAQAGYRVLLVDVAHDALERGLRAVEKSLAKLVEKGKVDAGARDAALARIAPATALSALAEADLVVEAVVEKLEVKAEVLGRLAGICPPHTILASNTSSISITRLAASTGRPGRVIGMHFMNPVPVMKLVEVIRGLATTDETTRRTLELAQAVGKTAVEVNDYPGFVANRILMPMINEAVYCLMEGVGTPEAIDTVMKLGMNHPMGPLALADLIGLDTCLAILEVMQQGLGDPKYRPCPLLRKYVAAGWVGRKSGRGFHDYA